MNYFIIFVAVAAAFWLAGLVCSGAALIFSRPKAPRRFWAPVILAVVALAIGYLGLHTHITYSRTVNGHGWSLDSRWFFVAPLVLGAVALALTLWRRYKSDPRPVAGAPPRIQTASNA